MEDSVFRDGLRSDRYPRTEPTTREQQVLELVEQGFKNKDIANELGIRPGTVKIQVETYLREDRYPRTLRPGAQ
jgi:DNA-binding NarL/FixJ family response regulator